MHILEVRNAELLESLTEVVVEAFPDDGPPGKGRISDTRVTLDV